MEPARRYRRRRRVLAAGAFAAAIALIAVGAFVLLRGGSGPDEALAEFLAAYEQGDYATAAALTTGEADEVAAVLEANVEGLDGAELSAEIEDTEEDGGEARATVRYSWVVPEIGDFSYVNRRLRLTEGEDGWRVRWSERVVHPELREGERLGTVLEPARRGNILDRDGNAIVRPRGVVEIGVIPSKLSDRRAAIAAIASETEADARALRRSIRAAEPANFVPAITVRAHEFEDVRSRLAAIEGVEFGNRTLPLAPSREFARPLLGSVGPVTAEQLEELGDRYSPGDLIGQGGLQGAHEETLAGTPARRVVIRRAEDGAPVEALLEREGERGRPLRTTLSLDLQRAAERALGRLEDNAALVAVQPSSGDVLAVANRPVDDGFNRAFEGQYPPGSTFKVVSTAALLADGLSPDEQVPCPPTASVGGRSFRNFEGGAAGNVAFSVDFAESCNTAFVSLAGRLSPRALSEAGERFGLGAQYELAVPAFSGDVPRTRDEVEQAAAMIGQGRILASPLAMAGVAATVAAGRWRSPRILDSDPSGQGPRVAGGELETLRSLMRDVVTGGTGTALSGVSGAPIGKSGTAEYGSGDPPPTHAWFIAARGDLAVAVLVEDRPSGGAHAAPIVADFLEALE